MICPYLATGLCVSDSVRFTGYIHVPRYMSKRWSTTGQTTARRSTTGKDHLQDGPPTTRRSTCKMVHHMNFHLPCRRHFIFMTLPCIYHKCDGHFSCDVFIISRSINNFCYSSSNIFFTMTIYVDTYKMKLQ